MPQTTTTLAATSLMPSLTVDNLQTSMDLFTALGFDVTDRWEQDGKLLGVTVTAGPVNVGLSQDDGKKGTGRAKGVGLRFYIEATGNIDALAARVKAAGVTLARDAYDTAWKTRAFEVVEPSGFLFTISSPAPS
jgi:uncharacterized glyoxalase superfamily protein PhnB